MPLSIALNPDAGIEAARTDDDLLQVFQRPVCMQGPADSNIGPDCLVWPTAFNSPDPFFLCRGDDGSWTHVARKIEIEYDEPSNQSELKNVAFDYNRCGKLDHILAFREQLEVGRPFSYRILKWEADAGSGEPFLQGRRPQPNVPVGCEFLQQGFLRAIAFDWESSGFMDHVMFYIGAGQSQGIAVVKRSSDNDGLETVFAHRGTLGDLTWPGFTNDYPLIAIETENYGKMDTLLRYTISPLYVTGVFEVLRHRRNDDEHTFENVFTLPDNSFGSQLNLKTYWYFPCPVIHPITGAGVLFLGHTYGSSPDDPSPKWSILEWNRFESKFEVAESGTFPPETTVHFSDSSLQPLDYKGSGMLDHFMYLHMNSFGSPHHLDVYRLVPATASTQEAVMADTQETAVASVAPVKPLKLLRPLKNITT